MSGYAAELVTPVDLKEAAYLSKPFAPAALVSCIFTVTADLNAEFPAVAARNIGLNQVPLLCTREIDVPGSLPLAIRIMVHYYAPADHVTQHVYLRDAVTLRTDLTAAQ